MDTLTTYSDWILGVSLYLMKYDNCFYRNGNSNSVGTVRNIAGKRSQNNDENIPNNDITMHSEDKTKESEKIANENDKLVQEEE